ATSLGIERSGWESAGMANVILWFQRTLLWLSYHWYRLTLRGSKKRSITWVVGTNEIASMVTQISRAIPGSFSVAFEEDHYYAGQVAYDYTLTGAVGSRRRDWSRKIFGPFLLG